MKLRALHAVVMIGIFANATCSFSAERDASATSFPERALRLIDPYAPGKLAFASSGTGGSGHLAVELFMALTQTKMVRVPYKGNGPALLAQVSGEVQVGFNNILAVVPPVPAG